MALNVLHPVLIIRLILFVCLLICKTIRAMMSPACMGQLLSICPIILDANFVHLAQGLSAIFLD